MTGIEGKARSLFRAFRQVLVWALAAGVAGGAGAGEVALDKAHPSLEAELAEAGPGGRIKAWVEFHRDKDIRDADGLELALAELERSYDARAVRRRALRRSRPGLFDVDDLPLPGSWVGAVRSTGAEVVVESRWAHAVSVRADRAQLREIAALPFVEGLRPVRRGGRPHPVSPPDVGAGANPAPLQDGGFYGESWEQIKQLNLHLVHSLGYTGAGVRVGILDTGFRRDHEAFNDPTHPLDVVAEWDFVDDDPNTAPEPGDPANQHEHGTLILGTLGAYQPGVIVGAAYDASFILAKAEDVTDEYFGEEDLFVAGLEFIEANGGDVATSSLVIFSHYTQDQLDGLTSTMTLGINIATANGLHVCQGVGNSGHDANPATSTMVPPSDAFDAISVGAVDSLGVNAEFTSDGPTADGRLKPEVLARGVDTRTVNPFGVSGTTGANGTSLSTPMTTGVVASLLQAHPDWTVPQLRAHLFLNAQRYRNTGAPDPLYVEGFGIIDALATLNEDCNANGVEDPTDLGDGASGDCNSNSIPDECDVASLGSADAAADGLPDECDECTTGPGCPVEVQGLRLAKDHPDVLLSWNPSVDAASYSVRRDDTAPGAGSTEIAQVPSPTAIWSELDGLLTPPPLSFYVVRPLTPGGIAGP